jgi:hypothetical protein
LRRTLQWRFSTPIAAGCIFLARGSGTIINEEWALFRSHMLDGVRGRDSGVSSSETGAIIGGDPYFWSAGSYTVGNGTWKGELRTNQHTPFPDRFARYSPGRKSPVGFRELLPTAGPRCSAPPWWETEA